MAGKTKINGTNYTISGGKTKISGTNYSIVGGRTKINGTNYSISFSKKLTIIGSDGDWTLVRLNNADKVDGTYDYTDTSSVRVWVIAKDTAYSSYCRVYLNGTLVQSGDGPYTISSPGQYNSITVEYKWQNYNTYPWAYITTT